MNKFRTHFRTHIDFEYSQKMVQDEVVFVLIPDIQCVTLG